VRKVNPADVRADFSSNVAEVIVHFDRVCGALTGQPTEKQDISRLGSVPKSVEKGRGVPSDVIALEIGCTGCPYSPDLQVA
jgi:hypothetical protein